MFIKHSKQIIVKNLHIDLDCLSNLLPQTTINWNWHSQKEVFRFRNSPTNKELNASLLLDNSAHKLSRSTRKQKYYYHRFLAWADFDSTATSAPLMACLPGQLWEIRIMGVMATPSFISQILVSKQYLNNFCLICCNEMTVISTKTKKRQNSECEAENG